MNMRASPECHGKDQGALAKVGELRWYLGKQKGCLWKRELNTMKRRGTRASWLARESTTFIIKIPGLRSNSVTNYSYTLKQLVDFLFILMSLGVRIGLQGWRHINIY